MVLDRIVAQKGGEGEQQQQPRSWRAAVLRAGLNELACDDPQNKELYFSLAVIPKGLAFPLEVAAVLLYGDDLSAGDLEAAKGVAATLERWSILTLEERGEYRVHDEFADFVRGRFAANADVRDRVLPRWRRYISTVPALLTFSGVWLVEIWKEYAQIAGEDVPPRPFDAALETMDPLSTDRSIAIVRAGSFHSVREESVEAFAKFFGLLAELETSADFRCTLDVAQELSIVLRAFSMQGGRRRSRSFIASACYLAGRARRRRPSLGRLLNLACRKR